MDMAGSVRTYQDFSIMQGKYRILKGCIEDLNPNGIVKDNNYEWGSNPVQNVFLIDVRTNGIILYNLWCINFIGAATRDYSYCSSSFIT